MSKASVLSAVALFAIVVGPPASAAGSASLPAGVRQLGYTIDIVSGRPVDRRTKDRLFDPLKMGSAPATARA